MTSSAENKISTLIQFAYRAGKVYFGESVIIQMLSGKIKVMILARDVAPAQEKKYLDKAGFYRVKVVRYLTKAQLGELFGKNEVACIGISDASMAREMIRLAD